MRRSKPPALPASKPRNRVVQALLRLAPAGSGRNKNTRQAGLQERKDPDERVREYGEW